MEIRLNKLPQFIDPRKLAQQGVNLTGGVDPSQLPRLTEALVSILGPASVELTLKLDGSGQVLVEGQADIEVELVCQRCLEPVASALAAEFMLAAVNSDEDAKQLPREYGPWLIEGDTSRREGSADLYKMIEDELLLAIPIMAYHEEACLDEALYSSGERVEDEEKPNPFAALKQLQRSPKE